MPSSKTARPIALYVMTLCLLILAVNALPVGLSLMTDPSGSGLGMSVDWLANSPFPTYAVPGLFLFAVIGLGSVIVALALWLRPSWALLAGLTRATHEHWAWSLTLAYAVVVVLWIIVQYLMLRMFHPLQIIVAAIAIGLAVIDLLPGMRRYLQP